MTRASGAASVSVEGKPFTEGEGRVVRLHGARDLRIESAEIPRPKSGEVLLRVTAVGLCGSDRHWFDAGAIGDAQLVAPLVLGHEIATVVASGPRTGERIAVYPAAPCDECEPCRSGQANFCPAVRFAGHSPTDGALRDWMCWPERLLHPFPDRCPDPAGALLEPRGDGPRSCALRRVRRRRPGLPGTGIRRRVATPSSGGSIGYRPREVLATRAASETIVSVGMAFAWNPSVTGANAEDTLIVTEAGPRIVTRDPAWPRDPDGHPAILHHEDRPPASHPELSQPSRKEP